MTRTRFLVTFRSIQERKMSFILHESDHVLKTLVARRSLSAFCSDRASNARGAMTVYLTSTSLLIINNCIVYNMKNVTIQISKYLGYHGNGPISLKNQCEKNSKNPIMKYEKFAS